MISKKYSNEFDFIDFNTTSLIPEHHMMDLVISYVFITDIDESNYVRIILVHNVK